MVKKISLFVVLFMAAVLIVFTIKDQAGAAVLSRLDGYLTDKHCFSIVDPSKDSVSCLQMDCCAKSGYGVAVKQKNGKYKFYKFDKKGNDISKDIINNTKKVNNIPITVRGYISGGGVNVVTIKEK